jgi:NAD(P)H-hydrate epimerase
MLTRLITKDFAATLLPLRLNDTNKADYGKALIIAGSKGMAGAAVMAGTGALKSGCGLVRLCIPESINNIVQTKLVEAVTIPLEDKEMGCISKKDIPIILEHCSKNDITAIGPGLSNNKEALDTAREVILNSVKPMIIDADGINSFSGNIDLLNGIKHPFVITPHCGELSRLIGVKAEEISKNKATYARTTAQKTGGIVVLKGWHTIISTPDGECFENTTGNPGMATAGSGDILTGIIASFSAQGLPLLNACIAGVFIHGLSGDIAAQDKGQYGMTAADIMNNIPYAIKQLLNRARENM